MVDEVLLPGEAFVAVRAGVGRVARVLADVVVEMLLAGERARAVRALVRRFTRVLSAQQSTFRFEITYLVTLGKTSIVVLLLNWEYR